MNEGDLNGLGYVLMGQQKMAEAIAILGLVAEAWPQSANAYDSLGEAYARSGDKAKAIENYQRSLDLDPNNANAATMLKQLKAQ
ncbi:MAG: tetratricopeptide repeat protein [Blastocatellia bacterium]